MQVLEIREDNLKELELLKTVEAGSIQLSAVKVSHDLIRIICEALKTYGASLHSLKLELLFPSHPYNHDLKNFNFLEYCPNLKNLELKRCDINDSIFAHPKLSELTLNELWIAGKAKVQIGVDLDSALERLYIYDCNWCDEEHNSLGRLCIGVKSNLKVFEYSVDEDFLECVAEIIEVDSCQKLEEMYIRNDSYWKLILKGKIPVLQKVSCDGGSYGQYTLSTVGIEEGSSEYLVKLRESMN
ncbi:MAG: hypothetical protein H7A25_12650 [Leptospiraceae bacterium]|nr:hypothetical protein [Leptospiraceae bacterium]